MIRAIIFDFDGVLVESVQIKTEAFREMFRAEGAVVEAAVVAYHEVNAGVPRLKKFQKIYSEILHKPISENELSGLCSKFEKLVKMKVIAAPYVRGAKEFVQRNKDKYAFFVASAAPQKEIQEIIYVRGMGMWFTAIYGFPTSKQEAIRHVMNDYGLTRSELVFVGDARADLETASSTGLRFVARLREGGEDFKDVPVLKIKDITSLENAIQGF